MSTTVLQQRRILFVDDDVAFLEMISRIMGAMSHGSWEIFTAHNTGKALAILQDNGINMVVIDVQMPVVDGFQFLTLLNRRYPNLSKVVMTGFANDNYRAACLSSGAEMFLEKPQTQEGFESLYGTLNELSKWQPEEGFRGVLRRVGLQDVIQMECLSRNSSILEISAKKETGRIFIQDGTIIHAAFGARTGEEALNYLLALKGGEFKLRTFVEPPTRNIEGSWEFLLMEASRLRDETESETEPEPTGEAPASGETAPRDVRRTDSTARATFKEPAGVSMDAIPDMFRAVTGTSNPVPAAVEPEPVLESVPEPVAESAPEPVPAIKEGDLQPRQIDEVLVCYFARRRALRMAMPQQRRLGEFSGVRIAKIPAGKPGILVGPLRPARD